MISFTKYIKNNSLLDKTIQIFSGLFFICVRKLASNPKIQNSKIIVISLNKLGDTVFTIPAIKILLKEYNNKITIFCFPESKIIYEQVLSGVQYQTVNTDEFKFGGRIASHKARKLLRNI